MPTATTAQRVPETMSPSDIGAYMAQLRIGFNLSQQEVSERLHIRTRYVSAIEEARYDLMPGKVYARGYIHTYAEFLGLDADQVVQQCFAGETYIPPSTVTAAPISAASNAPRMAPPIKASSATIASPRIQVERGPTNWRGYGVLAAVGLVVLLVVTQIAGRGDGAENDEEATVAPVPEAMLQSVRNQLMPTAENHDCLLISAALNCFYTDATSRALTRLEMDAQQRYTGGLDLSAIAAEPAAEDAPPPADDAKAADGEPSVTDEPAKSDGDE